MNLSYQSSMRFAHNARGTSPGSAGGPLSSRLRGQGDGPPPQPAPRWGEGVRLLPPALPNPPTGWGDGGTWFPHPPARGLCPPKPSRGWGLGADRTHERRGALWRWDALIGPHPLPLSRARERGDQSRALGRPNAVEAALARMFCPPLTPPPAGGLWRAAEPHRAWERGQLARGDAPRAGDPAFQARESPQM